MAWKARNKTELIIEVWEKLDCESVGAGEIEAIDVVVADLFGADSVDSSMVTARLLADEGASLRHAEIMSLYIRRARQRQGGPGSSGEFDFSDLHSALSSIAQFDQLRSKFLNGDDQHGLRAVREAAIRYKDAAEAAAKSGALDAAARRVQAEICDWLRIWIQTPEVFGGWLELRRRSAEFKARFGQV